MRKLICLLSLSLVINSVVIAETLKDVSYIGRNSTNNTAASYVAPAQKVAAAFSGLTLRGNLYYQGYSKRGNVNCQPFTDPLYINMTIMPSLTKRLAAMLNGLFITGRQKKNELAFKKKLTKENTLYISIKNIFGGVKVRFTNIAKTTSGQCTFVKENTFLY